jgi:hypothetical protein
MQRMANGLQIGMGLIELTKSPGNAYMLDV